MSLDNLIYIGPSLRGKLNRFTVFRGGIPKHLEKQFQECPEIANLFVSTDTLDTELQKIERKGTPQNLWYGKVQEYLNRR